jgi:ribA/ribD-fused uncharacterized protein
MHPDQRLAALIAAEAAGCPPADFLFFWGHRPQRDGSIGPSCLSQWWPSAFTVDHVTYLSAEHWMMAGKARLFGDGDGLAAVLAATTPAAAKAAGRRVAGFNESSWDAARFDIVVAGNLAKFGQNEDLRLFLIGTGVRVLVEASPRDRIWGIGLGAGHKDALVPSRWRGINLLGFALMNVRDML